MDNAASMYSSTGVRVALQDLTQEKGAHSAIPPWPKTRGIATVAFHYRQVHGPARPVRLEMHVVFVSRALVVVVLQSSAEDMVSRSSIVIASFSGLSC
jgi:hypothetical protein